MKANEAYQLATGAEMDYDTIGFLCGLEIHQQLDTKKLFSPCDAEVVDPDAVAARTTMQVLRRLRMAQSELGETDSAVLSELKRRRSFKYVGIKGTTSLVELDEEPPHPMDKDALDVTLQFAGLTGARPADEIHVMRKTVIDGSNTSGFQRTSLVATGGTLDVPTGDVGIWTIAVEEDSARKLDDEGGVVRYTLDRLGIPLIEVATAPEITNPQHAQDTARRIGGLLRATKKVKRGLGTIRQDLNVSVGVGDRIEIKGCQDLRAVPRAIENECRRQFWLHYIRETLNERGWDGTTPQPVDVSECFTKCESKMVKSGLTEGVMLALVLPKWNGLMAGASKDGPRMGREFADHAKVYAGVKGVFHSDELPAYGIGQAETDAVSAKLGIGAEDGFVLCLESPEVAMDALIAVAERATAALGPCPKEVRAFQPDDSTRYMRPLPGAARMYPETDVPPMRVDDAMWKDVLRRLPMRPEERIKQIEALGVSCDLAVQLHSDGLDDQFEELAGSEPTLVARILLQLAPEWKNDLTSHIPAVLEGLAAGKFAKEAMQELFLAWDKSPGATLDDVITAAGAGAVDNEEVLDIVRKVVASREDFVRERGMAAMGPLMGPVMSELRGKADGKVVSDALQTVLKEYL